MGVRDRSSRVHRLPHDCVWPQVGEHAGCGPGNLPSSGFTYAPEAFMAARIGFYNLSWRDMGVPTLDRMLDIVQVGWLQQVNRGGEVEVGAVEWVNK